MIPAISEYTRVGGTQYSGLWLDQARTKRASLHRATVQFEEMGERTITTQIKVDGSIVPSFNGWELEFRGETFVLPTLKPQAAKENTSRSSMIDLVFTSAPIHELKRYFFAEMTQIEQGTIMIDKYVSSLRLSLTDFVAAFNRVLEYYFPDGDFVMELSSSYEETNEVKEFPIEYMYIWDVLLKFHEIYGQTWKLSTETVDGQRVTTILVGFDSEEIDDHTFEYGFDGGLLRFERHVEDTDIYNVLLGRGGEKNIPYRYFKDVDPYNTAWSADPDAIPELSTVYFSRLLDANFRRYVQGWKAKHYGDTYDPVRAQTDWAYQKGYTDTKFDPVEYVKDDDSIALYGVRQGKLDDNDDIYPTIQGIWLDGQGRADEVVDVEITAEDDPNAEWDVVTHLPDIYQDVDSSENSVRITVDSETTFSIPEGRVGRMEFAWLEEHGDAVMINTTNSRAYAWMRTAQFDAGAASNIPAGGPYHYAASMSIMARMIRVGITGRFGIRDVAIHSTPKDNISYRQVFTIWVKNIWETTQGNESDLTYAHRVWDHILGDRLGNAAAVRFSSGFMASSEDYEFLIFKLPEVDRTKSITTKDENGNTITVASEWKITLVRSDAEYEATGLYVPNTTTGGCPVSGDFFFFTGIDLPIQYVKWAEERLTNEKEKSIRENAWTNPTWVISLDKVRVHTLQDEDYGELLADRLDAGVLVNISDPRFTLDMEGRRTTLTLGIRSVSFTWNEPSDKNPYLVPDIEIVLSDKIEYQQDYDSVKGEVNYIQQNYTTVNQVKNIAKKTKQDGSLEIDGKINYLGPVIGTVEI